MDDGWREMSAFTMAMKTFFLIALGISVLLMGCDTVPTAKRTPVPASEVVFVQDNDGMIQTNVLVEGIFSDEGPAIQMPVYLYRTSELIKKCQYMGKVHWLGMLPEMNIPESASISEIGALPFVPDRVQKVFKENAGKIGANVVIVEVAEGNCRWIVENGEYQPEFLLWGKAYFKP
jgi:hypothetical protein